MKRRRRRRRLKTSQTDRTTNQSRTKPTRARRTRSAKSKAREWTSTVTARTKVRTKVRKKALEVLPAPKAKAPSKGHNFLNTSQDNRLIVPHTTHHLPLDNFTLARFYFLIICTSTQAIHYFLRYATNFKYLSSGYKTMVNTAPIFGAHESRSIFFLGSPVSSLGMCAKAQTVTTAHGASPSFTILRAI